ncbi:MAG TPA: hypothetical protein VJY65_00650 [Chloroflexota bacterium]|nr:hypothetical protein [Chloroflexota bacterium]
MRPALRLFLQEARRDDLLIQVYLDEGEIDHALEAVKAKRTPSYGYYGYNMALEVAKAAEETRPRAALELYQQHAESLIAQQGRQNYQQACRYLAKVRRLYERLGESDAWARYIADLRERNRRLRAVMEELAAAGL